MKKLIALFSGVVLLLVVFLAIFNSLDGKNEVENVYSVKTNHVYLSDGVINVVFKVYTNQETTLLKYTDNANVTLHDRSKDNVLTVDVLESYLSNVANYDGENLYEYSLNTQIDMTDFEIEDCYMSIRFTNKSYLFSVGRLEVVKSNCLVNNLSIINLYGLSSVNDISLSGIVVSLKNTREQIVEISNVNVGLSNSVKLYSGNICVKESSKIEDYIKDDIEEVESVRILSGETKTLFITIDNEQNLYLCNSYIFFYIDGVKFYIENFNYINSNDLDSLSKYVKAGIIYEI